MFFRVLRSQHGIGLVETLVATAVLGGIALAVAQLTSNQSKQMRVMRTMGTRDDLHMRIQRFAGNGKALVNSASHTNNAEFNKCVKVNPTPDLCDATRAYPFTLVDDESITNRIAGPGPWPPLPPGNPYPPTGTITGDPQLYDQNGSKCGPTPSAKCGIAVYTMFRADCGVSPTLPYTPLATCVQAKSVTITYVVMQVVPSLGGDTPVLQHKTNSIPSAVPLNITSPSGIENWLARWDTGSIVGVSTLFYEAPASPPGIPDKTVGIGTDDPTIGGGVGSFFTIKSPASRATAFAIARENQLAFAINPQASGAVDMYDHVGAWNHALTLSGGNTTLKRNATVEQALTVMGASTLTGNVTMSGNASVTGTSTLSGNVTMNGNASVAGTSTLSGDVTMSNNATVNGTFTGNVVNGASGTIGSVALTGNTVSASAFFYTSDERLKKDIQTIPNALERTKRLRGILFRWRETKKSDLGFLAQEVEKEFPELVRMDPKTGFKSVDYGHLVALLVEAIKEQDGNVEAMEKRLEAIEKKLSAKK